MLALCTVLLLSAPPILWAATWQPRWAAPRCSNSEPVAAGPPVFAPVRWGVAAVAGSTKAQHSGHPQVVRVAEALPSVCQRQLSGHSMARGQQVVDACGPVASTRGCRAMHPRGRGKCKAVVSATARSRTGGCSEHGRLLLRGRPQGVLPSPADVSAGSQAERRVRHVRQSNCSRAGPRRTCVAALQCVGGCPHQQRLGLRPGIPQLRQQRPQSGHGNSRVDAAA